MASAGILAHIAGFVATNASDLLSMIFSKRRASKKRFTGMRESLPKKRNGHELQQPT